ncbi:MAG: MATE family efflux transporter [Clostridia bacterium]|nr:MATE family efflux transporter [Clostridia bacterium]
MPRTKDMTVGSPAKLIVLFSLPIIAGNLLQQVYALVDALIVGRADGVVALAAVSSSGWLDWAVLSIAIGLAQGFAIQVAQAFGANQPEELRTAAGQSILLSILTVVLLESAAQGLLLPALRLLQTPEDTFRLTALYLRIIFGGLPFVMCGNLCGAFLRAVGDSRTPMLAVIIATLSNICLDTLFVVGFRWGVAGAAVATITAQGTNAAVCLLGVRRLPLFRLQKEHLTPRPAVCRRLVRLGLPVAMQNFIISIGGLVLQRVVNSFGFLFMAGYSTASRFQGMLEMAGSSLGAGVATFTGQNVGAQKPERVREGVRKSAWIGILLALMIMGVVLLLGRPFLTLFIEDDPAVADQVLDYASTFLRVMSAGLSALYLLFVFRSALQGMGDTLIPMLSGVVELIMRVLSALLLPRLLGEWGVYLAEVLAWLGAMLLLMFGYLYRARSIEKPKATAQSA